MELKFIKCKRSDLIQLVALSKKTFSDAFRKDNQPDDFNAYLNFAFTIEKLSSELDNPDTKFYYVYSGKNVVGYFKLNKNDAQTDIKLKESMELERIYVLQELQGNGIGERMLQKAKDMAKEERKCFLWLGVWEKNVSAIKFYERHGFNKFGTHPYFIGKDKQTDWLMRFDFSTLNPSTIDP